MVDPPSATHIALALVLCTDSVVIPHEMLAFPAPCVTMCKNTIYFLIYLIAWFIGKSFVGKHNNNHNNNKNNNISLLLLFCISDQFSQHGTNSIILECLVD